MKRILFQGDSITDANRSRELDKRLGSGYATLVSARLGFEKHGKYEFLNRGIGGNRSIDLLARIKPDIIDLRPDFMSILIGVNDVWHELTETRNGIDALRYEKYYEMIIEEVKEALPEMKIMILEPFVLKGTATEEQWTVFRLNVEKMAEASRKIAKKYGLKFVPLIDKFDEAAKLEDTSYWLYDGVHPTAAGHEIIAREWLKAFEEME